MKLDDPHVFAPDVSWYGPSNRLDVWAEPPYPLPAPAIEIRSRSTWRYDIGALALALDELFVEQGDSRT